MYKKEITASEIVPIEGLMSVEQETSVNWLRVDKVAVISTTDNTVLTKLKKRASMNPKDWKCYALMDSENEIGSYQFVVPIKFISFRTGREFSEEEKQKMIERGKKLAQMSEK